MIPYYKRDGKRKREREKENEKKKLFIEDHHHHDDANQRLGAVRGLEERFNNAFVERVTVFATLIKVRLFFSSFFP